MKFTVTNQIQPQWASMGWEVSYWVQGIHGWIPAAFLVP